MAGRAWHFLINSFLVATFGSYRAMNKIANYTLNALNVTGNVFLLGLYARLLPFVTDFNNCYVLWVASLGIEVGSTNSLYVEFQLLRSTYISAWDIQIQAVYNIKTTMYKSLLKNRRKPFQQGSMGDKYIALVALRDALIGVPGLAATLADVNAKVLIFKDLMDGHSTNSSGTSQASTAVETSRIKLGKELYGILGQMMDSYREKPEDIAAFFDITTIRNMEQTLWSRFAKAGKTAYLFTRTLLPADKLKLVNLGLTTLRFSFIENKKGVITENYIDVAPMSSILIERSLLGLITNRYCMVENLSADDKGKFMVVLV
jgi:hypothetical protein